MDCSSLRFQGPPSTTHLPLNSREMLKNLAVIAACLTTTWAQCASTNSRVGFGGTFELTKDELEGTITIDDDCTFTARISVQRGVPDIFFWGNNGPPNRDGFRLSNTQISRDGLQNAVLTIKLLDGITWDSITNLYIWCESFAALIGKSIIKCNRCCTLRQAGRRRRYDHS